MNTKIGIDIGNVIVGGDTDQPDRFFTDRYLDTPPVPGAIESIAELSALFGAENLFLVSKCGANVERKSKEWLASVDFSDRTGIAPEQFHFCRLRPQKRDIALALGLKLFVDDRFSVLEHLLDLADMRLLLLFAPQANEEELYRRRDDADKVRLVRDWPEALATLQAGARSTGV